MCERCLVDSDFHHLCTSLRRTALDVSAVNHGAKVRTIVLTLHTTRCTICVSSQHGTHDRCVLALLLVLLVLLLL